MEINSVIYHYWSIAMMNLQSLTNVELMKDFNIFRTKIAISFFCLYFILR